MDQDIVDRHLRRIASDSTRAAYLLLIKELEASGFRTSAKSGHVPAVRFHNSGGEYLLAFIPNPAHLLFYLRKPLLRHARDLPKLALQNHGSRVRVNNAEETTIRVESGSDAEALIAWLLPRISGLASSLPPSPL